MTIDSPQWEQLPALWQLWKESFGDTDDFLDAFVRSAFCIDRCRCVTVDGTVVAALYWFDCSCRNRRVAYLYAIATAREFRGRGLCSALMENTHRHLKELGYEGAVLVPGSQTLFSFYERFGYRTCGYMGELRCAPSREKSFLRSVGIEEYAALRRRYLPEGGVIQEGESLAFLQEQANLWAGERFLLAARREGDFLFGLELLGDPAAAPAILRALDLPMGRFRIPDGQEPFAMYRPLGDGDAPPPTYFGLAFD